MKLNNKIKQNKIKEDNDDIKIIIKEYNDRRFNLEIDKEIREMLHNISNNGSLIYYIYIFICSFKISYKEMVMVIFSK